MMSPTLTSLRTKPAFLKRSFSAPPALKREPGDSYQSNGSSSLNLMTPALIAQQAQDKGSPKGLQLASKSFALFSAFSALVGLAGCGSPPPVPIETEVVSEVATSEVEAETPFSEGRTLFLDRSDRVRSNQFAPDPLMATENRGSRNVYEESYISNLVDRDVTQVPEGSPAFTAAGVDVGQASKLYFNADLQPAEWGGGTLKSGNFLTRPTRMQGRGSGISDGITQHQLSCIYNLEQAASIDGVQLDPGMYRLITMEPSSNVATPAMHKGVCPGHRLVQGDSGFAGDYKPAQTSPDGEQLHVNTDDIVQIWSLTDAEVAEFQQ